MATRIIRNIVSLLAIVGIGLGSAAVLQSPADGVLIASAIALLWSLFAFAA